MTFEWDEAKRQSNRAKLGVDFVDAQALFDGRPVVTAPGYWQDEKRFATTGLIEGRFFTVIWTRRNSNIRIISARRSSDGERRAYRAAFGS
jgi:uncharacterized DUF497 family protein